MSNLEKEIMLEEGRIEAAEMVADEAKGFLKKAFNDMKESAKAQHEVDKANFEAVKAEGISITIVSNNNETRVGNFAKPLDIPFIHRAKKPMGAAFRKAVMQMGIKREESVVIGDQLLTDIFGGNRSGFHTILVLPVAQSDGLATKFNRMVERRIMAFFKKKGMLQ